MLQSPLSSPTCAGNADAQASQPEPPEPQPGQSAEETWVTVFGFQPSELHVVLREFSKCGDMVQFGSGRQDAVNWVHIHYSVPPRPLSFQLLPHRPVHGVLLSAGSQQHACSTPQAAPACMQAKQTSPASGRLPAQHPCHKPSTPCPMMPPPHPPPHLTPLLLHRTSTRRSGLCSATGSCWPAAPWWVCGAWTHATRLPPRMSAMLLPAAWQARPQAPV